MSSRTNEVKPEWPIKTVEELVNENTLDKPLDGNHGGIHPKSTDYVQEGIPFIMANDLVNNKINFENCKYITEEQAIGLKKGKAIEGDVLLTHKATMGRTAIVVNAPSDYIVLTPQVTYYRILNKGVLNNSFLKYYFDSKDFQTLLNAWAQGGSTRSYLGITAQLKLPIRIPPLHEQKAIAHILSTLDDKIEVNNQINKTLENMAQAIFKQWFVDFEFPNEDGEPYKSSGGEMIESELGMIPKGWEVVKLETVCREITRGFTSKYVEKSRFKNLNQKVNKGEVLEKQYYKFLREDIEIPQNKFVKKYDILLNSLGQGTLGRLHFFIEDEENVVIDQHITIIRADHETSFDSYLYHLLSSSKYTQIFDGLVSGSTGMQMLNISKVRSLTVCMPPVDLQKDFDNRIKTLYKKKEVLLYENEYLKLIRDSLLPKLMSGEIRVPLDEEGDAS